LGDAEPRKQTDPLYRVIVTPDAQKVSIYGEAHGLPAGMQVNAYALLERRQLYEWMLEPLYDVGRAMRGR
jgi:membrane fusion protein